MVESLKIFGSILAILLLIVIFVFVVFTLARTISYAIYKSKQQIDREGGKNGIKNQKQEKPEKRAP